MNYSHIRKGNIVNMKNIFGCSLNYLITNVSKKEEFFDAMPIFLDDDDTTIPIKLSIPFLMVKEIRKVEIIDLLYMLGKSDPLIEKAVKKIIN